MSWKSLGKVRARTYGTKSPSRSEELRFNNSAKWIPFYKNTGRCFIGEFYVQAFRSTQETTEDVDNGHSRKHWSDCEHVYVIRTSRVLSPDGPWEEY